MGGVTEKEREVRRVKRKGELKGRGERKRSFVYHARNSSYAMYQQSVSLLLNADLDHY